MRRNGRISAVDLHLVAASLKGSHWALFEVPTGMAVSETRENEQCLEPLGAVEAVERAVFQLVTGGILC